ncbi:hypothetical protein P691DRAFT_541190 [Macrolepiota fuliginosa MF-IS2]|uniref:Uncharacterized protein n=1 Tax=Macrolepiota fuliginosa MF-IS2 TaxID=1400762 RepID=A0A9P6C5B8_9AGAR|nr:hypothetical protein P691DRAFT_541190 [Macrolepiota fuliginosa MF-IS2]
MPIRTPPSHGANHQLLISQSNRKLSKIFCLPHHMCTDHLEHVYKHPPTHLCFLRTYSNRICLQKLTESRIFTNATSFISTR